MGNPYIALFLLLFGIIFFTSCNSDSSSKSKEVTVNYDTGFVSYIQRGASSQNNLGYLVNNKVQFVKYNIEKDRYDTSNRNREQAVLILTSLLADRSLIKKFYEKEGLGYIEVKGEDDGINILMIFYRIGNKWILSRIEDLST